MKVATIKAHLRRIMASDDPQPLLEAFASGEDPRTLKRISSAWRKAVRQMTSETNDPDELGRLIAKMVETSQFLGERERAGKEATKCG
jgi:hypothetical protein